MESDLYVATDNPGSATVKIEKRDAPFRSAYLIPAFREGLFSCLSASRDGKVIVALCQSLNRAPEIYRMEFEEFSTEKGKILRSGKERSNQWKMTQLTHTNDAFFASHEMPSFESITYKGAQDKDIQAWLVKPPDFDKKEISVPALDSRRTSESLDGRFSRAVESAPLCGGRLCRLVAESPRLYLFWT